MVYAAVDVGSNTLRLLVAEVSGGRLRPIRYERVVTRLAAGIGSTNLLEQEPMQRSIRALMDFDTIIRQLGAGRSRAVGTSALREAENSGKFIRLAKEAAGMEIEVLSGQEEARLTALGVLSSVQVPASALIVDIGGGSTEFIVTRGADPVDWLTLPVGVVKLVEALMHSDPPAEGELSAIDERASEVVEALRARAGGLVGTDTALICTAGTASTLASIDLALERYDPQKIHNHRVTLRRLREMFDTLKSVPMSERAEMNGLEPQRADLIIPGIILTIRLMEDMGFKELKISSQGLLEGVVLGMSGEVEHRVH